MDEIGTTQQAGPARFRTIEIGKWTPLGGDVRLELAGSKTVLVGKNGAGKSILLEGLGMAAFRAAVGVVGDMRRYVDRPERFTCVVATREERLILYEYRWKGPEAEQRTERLEPGDSSSVTWEEQCSRLDDGQVLWHVSKGTAILPDGTNILVGDAAGLVNLRFNANLDVKLRKILPELYELGRLLGGVTRVRAGIPRESAYRTGLVITKTSRGASTSWTTTGERDRDRMERLALDLVMAHDRQEDTYREFVELGRRLGTWQDVRIERYEPRESTESKRELLTVAFDGVDMGRLADGTLRIAEILWAVLDRTKSSVLLIEEPETGIHPGLLAGLLDTIDAYSPDRQVIISTHSPQVVSWASPNELRLVDRVDGKTRVRSLSEQQVAQVTKYLYERTLGEYVYSGALDDEID